MRIIGDEANSKFHEFTTERGFFYGRNDVLKSEMVKGHKIVYSWSGKSTEFFVHFPTIFLHIPTSIWSRFTGFIREYSPHQFFLPWRWKAVYLDAENGQPPKRILICTHVREGKLTERLNLLLNRSLFIAHLAEKNHYDEVFGQEYILFPFFTKLQNLTFIHPWGQIFGELNQLSMNQCSQIYRVRGLFSLFRYHYLKNYSSEWKEVTIEVGGYREKLLIKKSDESILKTKTSLIKN